MPREASSSCQRQAMPQVDASEDGERPEQERPFALRDQLERAPEVDLPDQVRDDQAREREIRRDLDGTR